MKETTYTYKAKIGEIGLYATIRMEVELDKTLIGVEVEATEAQEWAGAVEMAALYFYADYNRVTHKGGFRIRVTSFDYMIIDTKFSAVFYASLCALYQAVGRENPVVIDKERGICLPLL